MAVEREEAQVEAVEVVELDAVEEAGREVAREVSRELALRDEPAPVPATLFRTDDPAEVVQRASQTADALMGAVRAHDAKQTDKAKKLISNIQGRDFPKVECWTLLGTMLGVFPVCVWTRKLEDGWEARVEARTRNGEVVGAAEAECLRAESNWRGRDDYALRSMAQTRATSKALSIPLRFVMTLAGLEGTPAEEMPTAGGNGVETRTVAAPGPNPTPAGEQKKVTTRQLGKIAPLKRELEDAGAVSEAAYRKVLKDEYGVESATELTAAQASNLIERLEAKRERLRAPAEPAQGTLA